VKLKEIKAQQEIKQLKNLFRNSSFFVESDAEWNLDQQ
jgi:hypothetical protein